MKKLFYFLLTLSVCLCFFSVFSLAAQPQESEESMSTQEATPDAADTAPTPSEEEDAQADATFLDALYNAYEANKSDIFSLASAIISLILVLVYQKGLLPTVKSGLTLIEGQVKALRTLSTDAKEQNVKSSDETRALALEMTQSAQRMQSVLEGIAARAENDESKQETIRRLEECLLWQTELLGEVFLHSSLPEYEKERVSHVLVRVKETLAPKESEA